MKLINYTKWPDDLLREIIAFVKPANFTNFDIAFKNSERGWKGKAYWSGCNYHEASRRRNAGKHTLRRVPYIVIGVPKGMLPTTKYNKPSSNQWLIERKAGYIYSEQYTPIEDMVHLIAHESRHLWQHKVRKGWRVWGARGQFSERDADAYAIRMTRAWRRK